MSQEQGNAQEAREKALSLFGRQFPKLDQDDARELPQSTTVKLLKAQIIASAHAAARLEAGDQHQSIEGGAGRFWGINEAAIDKLIKLSPKAAFRFACWTLGQDTNPDSYRDWSRRWLEGSGLLIILKLCQTNYRQTVIRFLDKSGEGGQNLCNKIATYMNTPAGEWGKEEAFSHPEYYSTIVALNLGVGFADQNENTRTFTLFETAKEILAKPEIRQVALYYQGTGDETLVNPLLPYINAVTNTRP